MIDRCKKCGSTERETFQECSHCEKPARYETSEEYYYCEEHFNKKTDKIFAHFCPKCFTKSNLLNNYCYNCGEKLNQ
jgi:hypothetical protein